MRTHSKADHAFQSVWADLNYIVDTGVKPTTYVSSRNAGRSTRREVECVHYPEIERLIQRAAGATRVRVFDLIRRSSRDRSAGARVLVFAVHDDYTPRSGRQRVRDLFPGEAADLLQRRFSLINAWQPVQGPVESFPLAVCDGRTIRPKDLVATDLVYEGDDGGAFSRAQRSDSIGEVFNLAHNPGHGWFYFPRMESEEILLFRCFDSAIDGRVRFTAHTAFDDPNTTADARPRESIELRALAFFA